MAKELLEEPDKSPRVNTEVKKTWGFRRSTVAKREMPVEAATDSPESRCPVRRSGRQPKRTDKLEEFLLTAKRATRKGAPPGLDSGDPPSQTPTDAETASEASFDGNADSKTPEDKVESPERKTRSSTRSQTQRRIQSGGRQTRSSGGVTVKDEGSSENEEDSRDALTKEQLQASNEEGNKDEKTEPTSGDVGDSEPAQTQPEQDSEREVAELKNKDEKNETGETQEDDDEDSADTPVAMSLKRGPVRTYVNKKRVANKNTTPVKATAPANKSTPAVVMKEARPKTSQTTGKAQKLQAQEDEDEEDDESDSSSSSTSIESDDGGYDPNALYCICRQKHNKRFDSFIFFCVYVNEFEKLIFLSIICFNLLCTEGL